MMLIWWSFQKQVVAAEVMVMPRSCSCSIQSMVGGAVVGLTDLVVDAGVEQDALGGGGLAGVDVRHDADVADLGQVGVCTVWPRGSESLRLAVGAGRREAARPGIARVESRQRSPAVVGEGAVGLGHLVGVLAALDRGTQAVGGVQDLVHQTLGHRLLAALRGEADQPAHGASVVARCRT